MLSNVLIEMVPVLVRHVYPYLTDNAASLTPRKVRLRVTRTLAELVARTIEVRLELLKPLDEPKLLRHPALDDYKKGRYLSVLETFVPEVLIDKPLTIEFEKRVAPLVDALNRAKDDPAKQDAMEAEVGKKFREIAEEVFGPDGNADICAELIVISNDRDDTAPPVVAE